MTATAFAFEPALDPGLDLAHHPRPQLRLIQGGGSGTEGPVDTAMPVSVEVYRRRRFIALAAATVVVLALAWAAGISVLSFGEPSVDPLSQAAPTVHVVMPGDSYAAIASDLGLDPVEAAVQLRAANGGGELVVGQRLVVDLARTSTAG